MNKSFKNKLDLINNNIIKLKEKMKLIKQIYLFIRHLSFK